MLTLPSEPQLSPMKLHEVIEHKPMNYIVKNRSSYLILIFHFSQPALRKLVTPINAQSAVIWGSTAAVGALWLVQPFDWIRAQLSSTEEKK